MQDDLEYASCAAGGELLFIFLNADAALLRDGCGVNSVDDLRVRKHAADGRVADEVSLALRETAGVGDLNGLQISGCRVREKESEALGHLDERCDLRVLLVRE